jgi:hypothetical protein
VFYFSGKVKILFFFLDINKIISWIHLRPISIIINKSTTPCLENFIHPLQKLNVLSSRLIIPSFPPHLVEPDKISSTSDLEFFNWEIIPSQKFPHLFSKHTYLAYISLWEESILCLRIEFALKFCCYYPWTGTSLIVEHHPWLGWGYGPFLFNN